MMKRIPYYAALACGCLAVVACSSEKKTKITMKPYPQTAKVDVTDNYHGTVVADPYRWLEDDNSPETAAWVAAENEVTFDYLSQIPYRTAIETRLTELWNYEKVSSPRQVGDYYFVFRNDGLQNQSVLYILDSLEDDDPEVFLDPNALSPDGTVALSSIAFSKDGKYMAYGLAQSGSDWVTVYVKEIPTGRTLSDEVHWLKFSGPSWAADSQGFYYQGYEKPTAGAELSGKNQFQKVYYHRIGTPQSEDKVIYADPEHPLRYNNGSDDGETGKWLFVEISAGTSGKELRFKKADSREPFRILREGFSNEYMIAKVIGDYAYIYTNEDAPNYRLIRVDLNNPTDPEQVILPEHPDNLLQSVRFVGDHLIAIYMQDAASRVYQYTTEGKPVREVELPGIGTAGGFSGEDDATEVFYTFSSFIAPPSVYRYDLATGTSTLYAHPEVAFDPEEYMTEQIFFTSKDGTQVPMFVSYRKGLKMNGKNPTYVYGYGGFNAPLTPGFNPNNIAIMEQGGIYVSVNLRGGNEYGEKWHRAGMLDKKQNVFDDFIAACEYLIDHKYTSRDKLAIAGGSNGGLLVGACMTQRPDLFAVAFPQVGVLDMLRYHLFTVGWGWAVEYGSSDDPEQFAYIYKYSPLHNIKAGTCYPATMITTGDHDDRVVPAHSFKFAATLQEAQGCDRPVLIRIESNAGHGAGKPTSKRIAEAADMQSFFFWNTDSDYRTIE